MLRLKHQKSEKVKQISLSTTSARNSWLRHGVKTDTMHLSYAYRLSWH